ncbi:MAG: phospho-sugar mutase [Puniceicoccales bacterium]|jgi:phosphoglucomutase|nr:phospho-sugar mutase [Puniceicoccales bacterium]
MAKNQVLVLAEEALREKKISASTFANLSAWVQAGFLQDWALAALTELACAGEWEEINDRFFQELAFGTGGIRGLTIGRVGAPSEIGVPGAEGTPGHAAIGSNNLNDITLVRATAGLHRHTVAWLARQFPGASARPPRLVIAHDVRHFSRHFSELAASIWAHLGGEAFIFNGPRSTPQLSFTVRHLGADAGVVITASHNPPQYNGFKCYFRDGAQVVPPHDSDVIAAVSSVTPGELASMLAHGRDLSRVRVVPAQAEAAYLDRLADNVLDPSLFAVSAPTLVFTNLHGTGDVMIPAALERFGVRPIHVEAQRAHDPRFPTVASPNPESAGAFALAVAEARKAGADIAIATDPDDDRVGAAVRERDGSYRVLTGNQIGSALAAYRIARMKALGILPAAGTRRAVLLKTFVTTPFQDAIALAEGIRVVNVPTGFKWIGAKLGKYQRQLEASPAVSGITPSGAYDSLPWAVRARLHLENASLFVFGGEESMGFLGTDATRDKDGNASALMLAELAAWLRSTGKTFSEFLDEVAVRVGAAFAEDLINIQYEAGATGQLRIRAILRSLREDAPKEVDGTPVSGFRDFGRQDFFDEDGDPVPKEDFYFFTLADGRQFAVRGSGTEPKIKYYLFARAAVSALGELPQARQNLAASLKSLEAWLRADAARRGGEIGQAVPGA